MLMINSLARIPSWIALHWKSGAVVAGFLGIAATCRWCLESAEGRDQRAQRRNKKELRALADKISTYGRNVHHRYPTGDVVVSEHDLAEQLRKCPDSVVIYSNRTAELWREFFLSSSRFNRFAHANRALPRSTHSGVTSHPHTPCEAWRASG